MKKPAGAVEALRRAGSPLARCVRGIHRARGPKLFMTIKGYVARMTSATTRSPAALLGLEERTAETLGLRYYAGGSGTPVVLVHGLGGAATNWRRGRAAARRAVPSARGRSARSRRLQAPSARLRCKRLRRRRRARRRAGGRRPGARCGPLLGGHVALRLAHRRPELVRALLLVAPAGIATGRGRCSWSWRWRASCGRRAVSRPCATGTRVACGTAERSSGRGSCRMRPRSPSVRPSASWSVSGSTWTPARPAGRWSPTTRARTSSMWRAPSSSCGERGTPSCRSTTPSSTPAASARRSASWPTAAIS